MGRRLVSLGCASVLGAVVVGAFALFSLPVQALFLAAFEGAVAAGLCSGFGCRRGRLLRVVAWTGLLLASPLLAIVAWHISRGAPAFVIERVAWGAIVAALLGGAAGGIGWCGCGECGRVRMSDRQDRDQDR